MALWHFKFALVPATGIARVHGKMVGELVEYQPPQQVVDECAEAALPDYWGQAGLDPRTVPGLALLLLPMRSWSEHALMYGHRDHHRIEIWEDGVDCALDMRESFEQLLQRMLAIAKDHGCKIVISGSGAVKDPEFGIVMQAIRESGAHQFVTDPEAYFKARRSM